MQNKLDPNFIFNSLTYIQSYILEEKKESALEYLSDFSNVLRKKIENANKAFEAAKKGETVKAVFVK